MNAIKESTNETKSQINDSTNSILNTIKEAWKQKEKERTMTSRIKEYRKEIDKTWTNTLNTRSQAFHNYYKSKNLHRIYTALMEENPPRMPRKLQPKFIQNESPEDTEVRKQSAIEKFNSEIKLLKAKYDRYELRVIQIDCEMLDHLKEKYDEETSNNLFKKWREDCSHRETRIEAELDEKENWYRSNATSDFRREDTKNQNGFKKKQSFQKPQHSGNNQKSKSRHRSMQNNSERRPRSNSRDKRQTYQPKRNDSNLSQKQYIGYQPTNVNDRNQKQYHHDPTFQPIPKATKVQQGPKPNFTDYGGARPRNQPPQNKNFGGARPRYRNQEYPPESKNQTYASALQNGIRPTRLQNELDPNLSTIPETQMEREVNENSSSFLMDSPNTGWGQ